MLWSDGGGVRQEGSGGDGGSGKKGAEKKIQ